MANRLFNPITQYLDAAGEPLSGGKLYFYETGTATAASTYDDVALSSANANPVVLDSTGRTGDIFLDPSITYRVKLTDADDVTIWTADDVADPSANVSAAIAVYPGDPNGSVSGVEGTAGGVGSSMVYDSANDVLYVCTQTGTASTAVWTSQTAGSAGLGSANVFTVGQTIRFTDAGTSIGPMLIYDWESSTPAASDVATLWKFMGEDSAGNDQDYARSKVTITDPTNGSEDAVLSWGVITAGTLADELALSGAALYPVTNNGLNLGAASFGFNVGYLETIELGHDTDTTLARTSAGNVTIEGNIIYRAGGTDVPVTDGGTGGSSAAAAYANLGPSTISSFRAYKGSNQSIASASPTKVTFTTEAFDVGSDFASSAWTPAAGTAVIQAHVTLDDLTASENYVIMLRKNGTNIAFNHGVGIAVEIMTLTIGVVDQCSGSDTYEIYVQSTADTSYTVLGAANGTYTTFSGSLL